MKRATCSGDVCNKRKLWYESRPIFAASFCENRWYLQRAKLTYNLLRPKKSFWILWAQVVRASGIDWNWTFPRQETAPRKKVNDFQRQFCRITNKTKLSQYLFSLFTQAFQWRHHYSDCPFDLQILSRFTAFYFQELAKLSIMAVQPPKRFSTVSLFTENAASRITELDNHYLRFLSHFSKYHFFRDWFSSEGIKTHVWATGAYQFLSYTC